jgi:hypothetical protein
MAETLGRRTDNLGSPRAIGWSERRDGGAAAQPLPAESTGRAARRAPEEDHVAATLPDANTRWRCGGCGNLTRFDVRRSRRTTEFWHFDLAGRNTVEDTHVEEEVVETVTCRWCGRSDAIELVPRAEADASTP